MGQTLGTIFKPSPAPSESFELQAHSETRSHVEKYSSPRVFSNNLLLLPLEIRYEIYRYVFGPQVICTVFPYRFSKTARLDGLLKASASIRAEVFEVLYRVTLFRLQLPYMTPLDRMPKIRAPWKLMQNVEINAKVDDVTNALHWGALVKALEACNNRMGTCWLTVYGGDIVRNSIMRFLRTSNSLSGFKRVILKLACDPKTWAKTSSSLSDWCLKPDIADRAVQEGLANHYNEDMARLLKHLETGLGKPQTAEIKFGHPVWINSHLSLEFQPQTSLQRRENP